MTLSIGVSTDVDSAKVDAIFASLVHRVQPGELRSYLDNRGYRWLQGRIRARFAGEGDDVVGRWARLRISTIRLRRAQGFGAGPILVRTGKLQSFLTSSKSTTTNATGASLRIPSRTPAGELGTKFRRAQQGDGRTARRPVLGMNAVDSTVLTQDLERWIWQGVHS
jgi:hypothetical protein